MNTTTSTLQVLFTDRSYQRSHMRAPRGRGSWAFEIDGTELPLLWAPGSRTYAEAKAWAKAEVQAMQDRGDIPACVTCITLDAQP